MVNPTNPQQLKQIEQDRERIQDHFSGQVAALEERMSREHDNTREDHEITIERNPILIEIWRLK